MKRHKQELIFLEGLKIALDNIDEVISIIRSSKTGEIAKNTLIERFGLSEKQALAILEMRLRRLTGLERDKIEEEYNELMKLIDYLNSILASEEILLGVIKEELLEIKSKYNDERRTQIEKVVNDIDIEDLNSRRRSSYNFNSHRIYQENIS